MESEERDIELDRLGLSEEAGTFGGKETAAPIDVGREIECDGFKRLENRIAGKIICAAAQSVTDEPGTMSGNVDWKRAEALLIESFERLQTRDDANLVLGRTAAEADCDSRLR